jgi:hypothetical protein
VAEGLIMSNDKTGGKKKDTIEIPRHVLEWWFKLVHLNPDGLQPRIAEYLNKGGE